MNWDEPGGIAYGLNNTALSQAPDWIVNLPAYETWTRVLFTFKRNAIDQTDGIVYFNGVSQTIVSFVAAGYASNFTVLEESNNFYLGIRAVTLVNPVLGRMGWFTVWNRQLSAGEAASDAASPLAVTSGLVSRVHLCPDTDDVLGGSMTVNGSLACASEVPGSGRIPEFAGLGWSL